jgi:hypothetical protein
MTLWYDLSPADYAKGLEYNAERCDQQAARLRAEPKAWEAAKPWASSDANRSERNAIRLRAMAKLCNASAAARAGDVDFLGLSDPSQTRDQEHVAIATIEALVTAMPLSALPGLPRQ